MFPQTHIKIAREAVKVISPDKGSAKLDFGSIFPDSRLIYPRFKEWHGDETKGETERFEGAMEHLRNLGELDFVRGVESHLIADEVMHDEEDGYGHEKAKQLGLDYKLDGRYQVSEKKIVDVGIILVEAAINELFVHSDGKPGKGESLKTVIEDCLNSRLIDKISRNCYVPQEDFFGLIRTVKKMNFNLFYDTKLNREITAYIIHLILGKKEEVEKTSTNSLFGFKRYAFYCFPNLFIKGATYLSRMKAKHIGDLFGQAIKLVEKDYMDFISTVKNHIKKDITPYS